MTAGLATYFLGSPLTALRRNIEISNRKDDNIYDRVDDGMPEEEMFSRVGIHFQIKFKSKSLVFKKKKIFSIQIEFQ